MLLRLDSPSPRWHRSCHLRRDRCTGFVWIRTIVFWVLMAGMVSGCRPVPPKSMESDPLVADVAGHPIRASRLELELRRRSGGGQIPVHREQILEELINLEAAYTKASRSGFLDNPEIQQAIRLLVVERFRNQWEQAHPAASPLSDERIREFYVQQPQRFMRHATINLAMIRLGSPSKATPSKRAELMTRAEALRLRVQQELGALSHFGPIAAEVSDDQPTRYRGGELGWMTENDLRQRLPSEVVALGLSLSQTGEISSPVSGPDGVYLLRLMGHRNANLRPLDEVRPQIEHELLQEARTSADQRWATEGRSGLSIQVYREVLAQIPNPQSQPEKPSPPAPMIQR